VVNLSKKYSPAVQRLKEIRTVLFLPIPRYGQICFYTHEQRLSPKVKQVAKKCE